MNITSKEFAARRARLLTAIAANNVAIVCGGGEQIRNGDVHYTYRPNSDLYYLTGYPEPDALAVFIPGRKEGEFILFNRERDPKLEQWTGPRYGQDGACQQFGADAAYSLSQLDEMMPKLLGDKQTIYYPLARTDGFDQQILAWLDQVRQLGRSGVSAPETLSNIEMILHELRLHKSKQEIALMRHAAEISAKAHNRAMRACRAGMYEYQLEAELLAEFMQQGSRATAYDSIVAGGSNACVLHYLENKSALKDGDLVLIDAGAEYEYYAADVSRTFPVSGRFNEAQKALYELVLRAQGKVIAMVQPGVLWHELQEVTVQEITQGLVELGILKGAVKNLIKEKAYMEFYMHRVGHWLGMDVHDVGAYKVGGTWRVLEPGMAFTVEPGLYIAADCATVDEKWRGIGIRIEDDVVVTQEGCEVLSKDSPKTVEEIEALMAG